MSCCGDKRKQWLNEVKDSTRYYTSENELNEHKEDKPDREFEYTGRQSLTITGASTGNSYHFRFNGDIIKVDYYDAFAMMAERDLKVIKRDVSL